MLGEIITRNNNIPKKESVKKITWWDLNYFSRTRNNLSGIQVIFIPTKYNFNPTKIICLAIPVTIVSRFLFQKNCWLNSCPGVLLRVTAPTLKSMWRKSWPSCLSRSGGMLSQNSCRSYTGLNRQLDIVRRSQHQAKTSRLLSSGSSSSSRPSSPLWVMVTPRTAWLQFS